MSNIEAVSETSFPTNLIFKGSCVDTVLKAAVGGAVIGSVTGLYSGCKTGLVLGFNPGSTAAGCLGDLVVGSIWGGIRGAVVCGLFGG